LDGKTPSNGRREDPAALPPLLGRGKKPRPATKGATPPWNPLERLICPVACHGEYQPLVSIEFLRGRSGKVTGFKLGVDEEQGGIEFVRK